MRIYEEANDKLTNNQLNHVSIGQIILSLNSIQVESNGISPVKTVETHSLLLLPHNSLVRETGKFHHPLNKGNFFDPN